MKRIGRISPPAFVVLFNRAAPGPSFFMEHCLLTPWRCGRTILPICYSVLIIVSLLRFVRIPEQDRTEMINRWGRNSQNWAILPCNVWGYKTTPSHPFTNSVWDACPCVLQKKIFLTSLCIERMQPCVIERRGGKCIKTSVQRNVWVSRVAFVCTLS